MRKASLVLVVAIGVAGVESRAEATCNQYWCDDMCLWAVYNYGGDPAWCCSYYDDVTWQACTPPVCGNYVCEDGETLAGCPGDCGTTNRIIYVHGRGFTTWPTEGFITANPAWTNIRLNFNANGRLHDGNIRNLIRDTLINHCGTHTPNQCIVITASAGAPRVLLALSDVAALGYSLRIPWQGHYASAEGGTEVADKWTRGWRRVVSKLLGRRKAVDDDLRVGRLRNDYWYIHYTPEQPVYMQAGERDETLYKKDPNYWGAAMSAVSGQWISVVWNLIGFKIRGNGYMPCDKGDGLVPVHSAGGYAQPHCNYSMCDAAAKYPWRTQHTCNLLPTSHMDTIAGSLMAFAAPSVAATKYFGSCNPGPETMPGVPEATTIDDSADVAGEPLEDECDRAYCLTSGEQVCERSDPIDRTQTSCSDPYVCYFGATPPPAAVCGDYVCEGDEWSSCPYDCYYCMYYPCY